MMKTFKNALLICVYFMNGNCHNTFDKSIDQENLFTETFYKTFQLHFKQLYSFDIVQDLWQRKLSFVMYDQGYLSTSKLHLDIQSYTDTVHDILPFQERIWEYL